MILRHVVRTLMAAAALLAGVSAAGAQTRAERPAAAPVEIGFTTGAIFFFPTFGARLTVPFHPDFAIEGVGDVAPWTLDERDVTNLFFQIQLRHRFRHGRASSLHATYGTSLFGIYTHDPEVRLPLPDGSVFVRPDHRGVRIESPVGLHAGIGGERPISRHAAVRWDVQVLLSVTERATPAPRATVGITWGRGVGR